VGQDKTIPSVDGEIARHVRGKIIKDEMNYGLRYSKRRQKNDEFVTSNFDDID